MDGQILDFSKAMAIFLLFQVVADILEILYRQLRYSLLD